MKHTKHTKEQPMQHEPPLVIDITPTRGLLILLAFVLVAAAVLGYLAWGQKEAAAAPASAAAFAGMRRYYLTQPWVDGDEALTACAPGYHMASLWEILDPSNLEYNTDLGEYRTDSGAGPPTAYYGWVRTGWESSTGGGIGHPNCAVWSSDASAAYGTIAYVPNYWIAGEEDIHIWNVTITECDSTVRVWCVED